MSTWNSTLNNDVWWLISGFSLVYIFEQKSLSGIEKLCTLYLSLVYVFEHKSDWETMQLVKVLQQHSLPVCILLASII